MSVLPSVDHRAAALDRRRPALGFGDDELAQILRRASLFRRHHHADLLEAIAHLSSRLTLHPGDLIMTGTPSGVGAGRGEFLRAGDTVKLWIEKIGEISTKMA